MHYYFITTSRKDLNAKTLRRKDYLLSQCIPDINPKETRNIPDTFPKVLIWRMAVFRCRMKILSIFLVFRRLFPKFAIVYSESDVHLSLISSYCEGILPLNSALRTACRDDC